jgi:hypothetical protein
MHSEESSCGDEASKVAEKVGGSESASGGEIDGEVVRVVAKGFKFIGCESGDVKV